MGHIYAAEKATNGFTPPGRGRERRERRECRECREHVEKYDVHAQPHENKGSVNVVNVVRKFFAARAHRHRFGAEC